MIAILTEQKIFSIIPTLTISCCLMWPVPKTIAFGGVATGSMKAQEAPIAMIKASPKAGTPKVSAIEINKGTKRAAEAVLEVNSVKNTMKNATINPMTNKCPFSINEMIVSAITLLAPESFNTTLRVIPPPKSIKTPQSVFFVCSSNQSL